MQSSRLPLLPILSGLVAGILTFNYIGFKFIFLCVVIVITAITAYYDKFRFLLIGAGVCLGYITSVVNNPDIPYRQLDEAVAFQGTITEIETGKAGKNLIMAVHKTIQGDSGNTVNDIKMLVHLNEFETNCSVFDDISFSGNFQRIIKKPVLPGDIDYSEILQRRGIYGECFVSDKNIKIIGHVNSFGSFFYKLRLEFEKLIESTGCTIECKEFLSAVLLGDRANIGFRQRELFNEVGLSHILALSGMHVAIISALIFILLMPLRLYGLRNIVFIVCILCMWFYTFLTGMSVSVVRAVIMMTMLFLAQITSRKGNSLNVLLFAGCVILLFNPVALYEPSFQLSFCAVATILMLYAPMQKNFTSNYFINNVISVMLISIVTLIGTALLSAYYFHSLPLYSIFANIPAAFLLPMIIFSSIILLFLTSLGFHIPLLVNATDGLYKCLVNCSEFFKNLPYSVIEDIEIEGLLFIPYFAAIILFAIFLRKKSNMYLYSSYTCIIMCIAFVISQPVITTTDLYILGHAKYTEIIACEGKSLYHHTPRPSGGEYNTLEESNSLHEGFLRHRKADGFKSMKDISFSSNINLNDNILKIGNKQLLIVTHAHDLNRINNENKVDFCLLCCPVNLELLEYFMEHHIFHSVLLPNELHLNHVKKINDMASKYNIACHSLRENLFTLENIK